MRQDPRFREIERERVSDRVAHEIMKMIAAGTLAPGERLPGERQLAEMMNVSRVSVRAALQELKAQGFVSAVQGGGTRITTAPNNTDSGLLRLVRADAKNLHELAEIRANIEVWAARRAARAADSAQIAAIGDALQAMEDPARGGHHKAEDDYAFHMAIAKATGSAVYMHLMSTLQDILEKMFDYHRYTLIARPEDDRMLLSHHRKIYDAIRARDPEAAGQAMQTHLDAIVRSYTAVDAPANLADAPKAVGSGA
ncbi:FadR/GntR family transcriptional regulator [Rhodovibrio salinarum]|uniref:Pyruvate dehydrogenase complex repressor n=1 Tax=Rhodovibrio salinarum TaxID=1087 RepID=A0A934QIF5_9PROT|nr:FadR/GntR family transcriptional regulator [Rhodovibrio salinarum]MBK1697292.1 FadR family transcriptional regulator [Rhodovibrio salinarum]